MKIKYPKKKLKVDINKNWLYLLILMLILILIMGSFLGGMFLYRSGYASIFFAEARSVIGEINTELRLYQTNGLPTVFLDIPFDSMINIEAKRAEALEVGILLSTDDDYVPASMHYNDEQTLDIKLRLKGDWTDHLKTEKWSFRIHVKEDSGAILGMKRFSLQSPETRNFVNEWGYHQNLLLENILTTRYHFVNVIINGKHKGVYALEEAFTEDLLESQKKREGVIIRFDEDFMWGNRANFTDVDWDFYMTARQLGFFEVTNYFSTEIIPFRGQRIARSEVLSEEVMTAIELLNALNRGELSPEEVLDEELWGRYYAVTDLWAANHGTYLHNERFYYNPNTGLLEPIAFDGGANVASSFNNKNELAINFPETIFGTSGVQKAYVETLERITSREYIEGIQNKFGKEFEFYNSAIIDEYEREFKLPWDDLTLRSDILATNLSPVQPIRGNYHLVKQNDEVFLKLDLVNLMVVPIQVNKLMINREFYKFKQEWFVVIEDDQVEMVQEIDKRTVMLSGKINSFIPVSIYVPIKDFEAKKLIIEEVSLNVQLLGGSEVFDMPIYTNYVPQGVETGIKPIISLEETLITHPFLVTLKDNQIAIKPGDWSVDGDLIIPEGYDVFISKGTTLRFEEESVFLAHGRINIRGEEDAPVLLTAQNEHWGGLVVINALEKSIWQYAFVEKMSGVSRSGWILTGGVNFYQSAVDISHSIIGNNSTEDALNIIGAPFSFKYVEFLNTPSDAFDGDFTTGTATNCSFHDIEGDAFDVSGTEATIADSYFINIGDKAISAGEKSDITLSNITIRSVSIGIASKDLSTVSINSSTIDTAEIAGLATYIKKPKYGPASIDATDIEILNTETPAICQIESLLMLNGESISPEDIDIDALYEQGVLGN